MLIYIWIGVAILVIILYVRKRMRYFKNYKINHLPTTLFFGNLFKSFFKLEHFFDTFTATYKAFPNDRFVGHYEFLAPTFVIRDIDLLKSVAVKDFDYFCDHRPFSRENDKFLSKSLFALKGEKWRDLRTSMSPAFTASKLRAMVPFMQECSNNLSNNLVGQLKKNNEKKIVIDLRDALPRYATDVIATCGFGLTTNSIDERDNEFFKMGYLLTTSDYIQIFKMMFTLVFPSLSQKLNVEVFSPKAVNFLTNIFLGTMKHRKENNIHRPDILHLLMETQKGTLKSEDDKEDKGAGFATVLEPDTNKKVVNYVWDDAHIVAQAIFLFFAGFDTVSAVMTFLLHELAINPDVQEKLYQEISETLEKYDNKLDYDKINQMKYLDMCVCESMRRWSPTGFTERICVKNYNMGKPNETAPEFVIPEGSVIQIPIQAIQTDEKHYENALKFDPERFSDENKHKINPYIYMPFGIGPRNCIASRFALVEVKTMAIEILRYFSLSPSASTVIPLQMDPKKLNAALKGGHLLTFTLRN